MAEVAATTEGRPGGGGDRPGSDWLILQRLDDLRRGQDELKRDLTSRMDRLETRVASVETRIDKIAGNERWLIGILAVAVLSMAAKLFFPAA